MYKEYDFALSFAGEDRTVARELARLLKNEGVRVFYDEFEKENLWGKNLYQHLQNVYRDSAIFCVIIISKHYLKKAWPKHELEQAQAQSFKSEKEYILPVRIDDTEIPGINDTTAYLDLNNMSIDEVKNACLKKLCKNSIVRQLFVFLSNTNHEMQEIILSEQRPVIRTMISCSREAELEQILSNIPPDTLEWVNHHNYISNTTGINGFTLDLNGQPWTSFTINLYSKFYENFS